MCWADTKLPGPSTARRPAAVAAGEPLEYISPDHLRFLTAAPQPSEESYEMSDVDRELYVGKIESPELKLA
jgi:hypothetical protein